MFVFELEIWNVIFRHLIPIYPIRPRLQRMQDGNRSVILHCDLREDPDIAQTLQYFIGESFKPHNPNRAFILGCLDPAYISYNKKPLTPKEKVWHKRKLVDIDRAALEGFLFPGSKAAFRDMVDKHAIWQLETNNERWRYPHSGSYDIPQS